MKITGSIVLYKNNVKILGQAIQSFLSTSLDTKLYLVDNSPDNSLSFLAHDKKIEYIYNNKNLGFGKAHNIAIQKSIEIGSKYHLVLNPDVYFEGEILNELFKFMEENPDTGLVMPKVLFPDGSNQYLCKLLPTPYDLLFRRFFKFKKKFLEKKSYIFEMKFTNYNKIMNVPYLSGCFMFLRTEALIKIGLFDERIFMYIEDADLTRRIHRHFKTIFYPHTIIYHHFAKGSHKNLKLLFFAIHGACIYFNKYGWFKDKERTEINNSILDNFKYAVKCDS